MQFNLLILVLLINTGLGQNDCPDLKDMVLGLKKSMNILMADNKDLKEDVNQLTLSQDMVLEQKEQLALMKESMKNLLADMEDLKEHQAEQLNFISFTAYASQVRSYETGDTVIFDQAVVNYGDSFNPSSSIFTCPATAYYLFYASLLSGHNEYIASRIFLDDDFIIGAYSDGRSETWDTGSMLIVTRCEEGSLVSIRTRASGVMDGTGSRETMFTGTLLALV